MANVVPISQDLLGALHRSLRGATRNDHIGVDRLTGQLDLTRREDYGLLLSIHHAVLQELRSEWRPEDREDFRAMSRRLQNDLRMLGFATAKPPSTSHIALAKGNQMASLTSSGARASGQACSVRAYLRTSPRPISILHRHFRGFNFSRSCKVSQTQRTPRSAMRRFKERS